MRIKQFIKSILSCLVILLISVIQLNTVQANDLVYHPQNTAFGGSPGATQVLLSKANAQNNLKDPDKKERKTKTQIERFEEQLERSILRKISRSITDSFDEDSEDMTGQSFSSDEFSVKIVTDNDESIELHIENFLDGSFTSLTIPKI
jgi:curli production assembly/transport component CsgF